MAVAFVALLIAVGGTSYAAVRLPKGSVTTKHIKKSAVTRAKIKNNAIDTSKVADGSLTGADIAEASLGDVPSARNAATARNAAHAGASGAIDNVTYKTAPGRVPAAPNADLSATAAQSVSCDGGQRVVGGGGRVEDADNMAVTDGIPDSGGRAWTVRVENGDTTAAHNFTVYAICVESAG
jgi:hypothetical protein